MERLVLAAHRWVGLVAGLGLLVISGTGVLLLFAPYVDEALNPQLVRVAPGGTKAGLDAQLAAVRAGFPEAAVVGFRLLPLAHEAGRAHTVMVREGDAWRFVQVDPYQARVLGGRDPYATYEGVLVKLHYTLFAGAPGQALVLVLGLALLASVGTGTWVYRKSLVRVFRLPVRWGRGARAWAADVHHLVGVASLLVNLVLAATGLVILWPIVFPGAEPATPVEPGPPAAVGSVDAAVARAREALPDLVVRGVMLPRAAGDALEVYGGLQHRPLWGATSSAVELEPASLEVRRVRDIREARWTEQVAAVAMPLHFGDWGGLLVRLVYAVLGLAPGLLSLTGALLWWKKRRRTAPLPQKIIRTSRASRATRWT